MKNGENGTMAVPDLFVDVCVLYHDADVPGQWVAHSLNTDHVAVGPTVLDALTDLCAVLDALLEEAHQNPNVRLFSPAPQEIRDKLAHARRMPRELIENMKLRREGSPVPHMATSVPYNGRVSTFEAQLAVGVGV